MFKIVLDRNFHLFFGRAIGLPPMPIFILFLFVSLVEIYLLLEVGSRIGPLWTILLIVLTAIVGAQLVRLQGLTAWRLFQTSLSRSELPALALLEGLCLLIAGALLLTPGFFTDVVGFAILIPAFRRSFIAYLLRRGIWRAKGNVSGAQDSGNSIEGNFKKIDD